MAVPGTPASLPLHRISRAGLSSGNLNNKYSRHSADAQQTEPAGRSTEIHWRRRVWSSRKEKCKEGIIEVKVRKTEKNERKSKREKRKLLNESKANRAFYIFTIKQRLTLNTELVQKRVKE